jgi:hypothetical protein
LLPLCNKANCQQLDWTWVSMLSCHDYTAHQRPRMPRKQCCHYRICHQRNSLGWWVSAFGVVGLSIKG